MAALLKDKSRLFLILLSAIIFVLAYIFIPMLPVSADECTIVAEWDDRSYAAGETVKISVLVQGFMPASRVSGKLEVKLSGFENVNFISGSGFDLDTTYSAIAQPSTLSISVPDGSYVETDASGFWNVGDITASVSGDVSGFSVSGRLQYDDLKEISVKNADYTVLRSSATAVPPSATAAPATDTPVPSDTPVLSHTPSPGGSTASGTAVPSDTPEPEATATMTVIKTPDISGSPVPPSATAVPTATDDKWTAPTSGGSPIPSEKEFNTISVGAVIFWSIVAMVAGIWIGILIGAFIWRKKSVFMTSEEKKIIGRY